MSSPGSRDESALEDHLRKLAGPGPDEGRDRRARMLRVILGLAPDEDLGRVLPRVWRVLEAMTAPEKADPGAVGTPRRAAIAEAAHVDPSEVDDLLLRFVALWGVLDRIAAARRQVPLPEAILHSLRREAVLWEFTADL